MGVWCSIAHVYIHIQYATTANPEYCDTAFEGENRKASAEHRHGFNRDDCRPSQSKSLVIRTTLTSYANNSEGIEIAVKECGKHEQATCVWVYKEEAYLQSRRPKAFKYFKEYLRRRAHFTLVSKEKSGVKFARHRRGISIRQKRGRSWTTARLPWEKVSWEDLTRKGPAGKESLRTTVHIRSRAQNCPRDYQIGAQRA